MSYPAYIERMITEKTELQEKIIKLITFLGTDEFLKLDGHNQNLLRQQRDSMLQYLDTLTNRIMINIIEEISK